MNDQRDAIERELWRRGLLLTGSEAGASAAVARVLRVQANVLKLSEDRRRRLLVLGAAEWRGEGTVDALRPLTEPMQRIAWVARDVEQWGEVEASRALGLPKSAVMPLVEEARQRLRAAGRKSEEAAAALREWSRTADPVAGVESARRGARGAMLRRRLLTLVQVLALLGAMAAMAWIGRDLMAAAERERAMRSLQESLSNPMPAEEAKRARHEEKSGVRREGPR